MSDGELQSIADLIPAALTEMREKHDWWLSLTDEQRATVEAGWEAETRKERERQLALARPWDEVPIPRRFSDASLDDFSTEVSGVVGSWIETVCEDAHCQGLLMVGPTGVGKTRLMWAIYRELTTREAPRMEIVKLVRLLSSLRPGGDHEGDETIVKLCQVPILAIDDIGAHKPSEWVNERLYEIIDTRYDNTKPIVATTNRKNLEEVLDDRLTSRLAECCETVFVLGGDRRRPR